MGDPSDSSPASRNSAGERSARIAARRIPLELELSAASRLVPESAGPRTQAARRMLTAAALHGIDLSLMWGTIETSPKGKPVAVRQVCLAVPGAGKTVMMVLSGPGSAPAAVENAERVATLNAACEALAAMPQRDIHLAQALPEPRESWAIQAFGDAGFQKVGELAYLRRKLEPFPIPPAPADWPEGVEVRLVRALSGKESDAPDLIEALDRSYEQTLDCPELCGLRRTQDVLESHKATGSWTAALWWLVCLRDRPHGCVLLNPCPEHGSVELVYLGLSPELRGMGIGRRLLDLGLSRLAGVEAEHVACAVDLRNTPARRLYERAGFREFGRRTALVRPLRGAGAA